MMNQDTSSEDLQRYFVIGRHLGMLEGLAIEDQTLVFEDSLSILSKELIEFSDISLLVEALRESFEMANELQEPKVYLRSLMFLTDKILQKLELTDME